MPRKGHEPYLHRGSNTSTAKKGVTETCAHGKWKPDATKYRYQWYRGTHKIDGATSKTYTPKKKDVGKKLRCRVTAKRTGWQKGVVKTDPVLVKG